MQFTNSAQCRLIFLATDVGDSISSAFRMAKLFSVAKNISLADVSAELGILFAKLWLFIVFLTPYTRLLLSTPPSGYPCVSRLDTTIKHARANDDNHYFAFVFVFNRLHLNILCLMHVIDLEWPFH